MNKDYLILTTLFTVLLKTSFSFGFGSPCYLKDLKVDNSDLKSTLSGSAIAAYKQKLVTECALYTKYFTLRDLAADQFGLKLEQIVAYQALRFVDRYAYQKGQAKNLPIELLFQPDSKDEDKPLSERSNLVWRNWSKGIKQVDGVVKDIYSGEVLDLTYFEKIHIGFFAESEVGDLGNVQKAGTLRQPLVGVISWPMKTEQEVVSTTAITQEINAIYENLGLLPTTATNGQPDETNRILDVKDNQLFPGDPKVNLDHLKNMLNFMNTLLAQARAGQPMIWKDRLFTPAEFAYFIQQYIVQIHAFYDGNGRTSRFWQDAILAAFGLPAGVTGDLESNDMLTKHEVTYQQAMTVSQRQLQVVESCLEAYRNTPRPRFSKAKPDILKIDPALLTYDCRILTEQ